MNTKVTTKKISADNLQKRKALMSQARYESLKNKNNTSGIDWKPNKFDEEEMKKVFKKLENVQINISNNDTDKLDCKVVETGGIDYSIFMKKFVEMKMDDSIKKGN